VRGDATAVVTQLTSLCRRLVTESGIEWESVARIALGVPGVVGGGGLELAPNLPPFDEIDLAAALGDELGVEVAVDNDVNLATEGEHRCGYGLGVDDFVFVALGTGIGMGIVAGGQLQRGATGAAGEIGLLPFAGSTLEELAGGASLAARYAVRNGGAVASALAVFEAAENGDAAAEAVLDAQADALAQALLTVQTVLDPALVVLGGGMGSRADVAARVQRRLEEVHRRRRPRLKVSALGERAGVIGAVEVARQLIQLDAEEPIGA
jgi:glucokinase